MIAGQCLQEGHDQGIFLVGKCAPQLQSAHDIHGICQRIGCTIVEIRIGQFNIAQGRHFELEAVSVFAGDTGQAFCLVFGLVRLHHAHFLERGAANSRTVVTGDTATVLEQFISGQFLLGDGRLAHQPAVKTRVGCDQGLFKFCNGQCNFVDVDFTCTKNLVEFNTVLGNGCEDVDRQRMSECHFTRVGDRAASLFLQISGAAVPKLGYVHAGIEHGGRIDRTLLPVMADRGLEVVGTTHAHVVAGVAGDETGLGKPGIEKQFFPQFHLGQVDVLHRGDGLNRFLGQRQSGAKQACGYGR